MAGPSTPKPDKNTSNFKDNFVISPKDILPYPKYAPKAKANRRRKKGRSTILTSTLEKNALLEELKKKEEECLLMGKRKMERAAKKENKKRKCEGALRKLYQGEEFSSNEEDEELKYDEGGDSPKDFQRKNVLNLLKIALLT